MLYGVEQLAADPGFPITAVLYYQRNFPLCVPLSCAFAGSSSSFTAWSNRLLKIRWQNRMENFHLNTVRNLVFNMCLSAG